MMVAAMAVALALILAVLVSRDPQPETVLDPITVQQEDILDR